jgi:hypothetical protein
MSELKHTPGPWFVVLNQHFPTIRTELYDCAPQVATTCPSVCTWGMERAIADANLIAASPEFLQIAIRLQEWGEKWAEHRGHGGDPEREMDAICRDAADLVTKATQQQ